MKQISKTITREEGPLELMTNGGSLTSNQKADVPKFGTVWFNPHAITNIFSMAEMASRYKITYNSSKEKAFLVHVDGKPVRFEETASGLYVCKPRNDAGITMVTTIEENKAFYTPRQFDQAKKARNLYHAIGTPSIPDFKSVLRMNLIKNCPITTKDINIAEKIFGQDISAIKGKTTRTAPTPVVNDQIEIPPELVAAQKDVILCIYVIKVNGLHFFATISKNLLYQTAQYVLNKIGTLLMTVPGLQA